MRRGRQLVLTMAFASAPLACVESDFLRGTSCSSDRDCGRSLDCSANVCGGCPPGIPLVDDACGCPGDRLYDCRIVEGPAYCMPVCRSARDACTVATSKGIALERCEDDPTNVPCYTVVFADDECGPDAKIVLTTNTDLPSALIANCPPPEHDDFDCVAPE